MFRSLHIAATGMAAQEAQLDAISNNLANTSTVGYKRVRADFQDLMYQTLRAAGTQTSAQNVSPTGLQVGSGVRMVATTRHFEQGGISNTGNNLDVAIEGNGFLVVQQPDGTMAYTRTGTLRVDLQGRLVTPEGMPLDPPISVPAEAMSISISSEGTVSATLKGQQTPSQLGQIQLANFVNPAGLNALGHNLFSPTGASGDPQVGNPGTDERGMILQGAIEHSNVDIAEEMINLVRAQRGSKVNTKVITAADEMLRSRNEFEVVVKYRALLFVLLASTLVWADQTRTVGRARINVGDIIPNAPSTVASIDLGPSPPPGGTRVVARAEVVQQIVAAGYASTGLHIPDTTRIVGASKRYSGAELVRMSTPLLERNLPAGVRLIRAELSSDITTVPDVAVKSVVIPKLPRQKGQFRTTVSVELASEEKVVARVTLPIVVDISEQASRPDIQRGTLVNLVIESRTVRISTQASSMSDGNIGDTLSFQVKSTGRILSARLESSREARIVERP